MAAVQVGRRAGTPRFEVALEKMRDGVQAMAAWVHEAKGEELGEGLIQIRESGIDPLEAAFAGGVRRFDQSGEYAADGAVTVIAWLKWKCKLSGGAAAERVEIARQLEKLPKTEAAFANGDLGYQHVALLARTAQHVGAAAVRKEEVNLLQAAQTMDPGQFTGVARNSNIASMPRAPSMKRTGPMRGATCTWASRRTAWYGSTACSMPKVAPPCGPPCSRS